MRLPSTQPPRLAIDSDELSALACRALHDSYDVAGHRSQIEQLGQAVFDLQARITELTDQLVRAKALTVDAMHDNAQLSRDLAAADMEIGRLGILQCRRDTADANTAAIQVRLQRDMFRVTGMTYEQALARLAIEDREFRSEERQQLDRMARGTQPLGFDVTDTDVVDVECLDAPAADRTPTRPIVQPLMSELVWPVAP